MKAGSQNSWAGFLAYSTRPDTLGQLWDPTENGRTGEDTADHLLWPLFDLRLKNLKLLKDV